ncbi:MAG: NAD(P)-dependent oxidoreductase [Synechococcales cyanobacterium CRU_2_2]|nr:NAD(P)-dependent oxidoreductase [Synechococcales cyanobacterium CRU_2_2]
MTAKRILITGASGCIGHYFTEQLIQTTDHELFILVRDPAKLQFDSKARPGIELLTADLREISQFDALLKTIQVAILAATSWGGIQEAYEINVTQTLALIQALDPSVCEQVLYFSTESILAQNNQLLPEAGELGTDYIRTKYQCFRALEKLNLELNLDKIPPITALFPTFVFGGDANKPYSHLTSGFPEVLRWIGLIRFLTTDASFHFMHGYDIAQVVCHCVDQPEVARRFADGVTGDSVTGGDDAIDRGNLPNSARPIAKIILGNAPITLDETIQEVCDYFGKRIYLRFPIKLWLAEFLIRVFRIQVGDWDRFCLRYRHFVHQNPVSPRLLGLVPYAGTLTDILKIYRFEQRP